MTICPSTREAECRSSIISRSMPSTSSGSELTGNATERAATDLSNCDIPVKAGLRTVGVTFLRESAKAGSRRLPVVRGAPPAADGVRSPHAATPGRDGPSARRSEDQAIPSAPTRRGTRRTSERRSLAVRITLPVAETHRAGRGFSSADPPDRERRGRPAPRRSSRLCAPRLSPTCDRRRHQAAAGLLSTRPPRRRFRLRHPEGARARCWCRPTSCSASSRIRRARLPEPSTESATSNSHRGFPSSCGAAFPDDELLKLAEQGKLKDSGGSAAASDAACSTIRGRRRLVSNFAGPVAVICETSQRSKPDPQMFSDFDESLRQSFQQETELFFAEHPARRPQRPRSAGCQLHVPERASGRALRDSEDLRLAVPQGAHHRSEPRRPARTGQHSDGDVLSESDFGGAAREMDS